MQRICDIFSLFTYDYTDLYDGVKKRPDAENRTACAFTQPACWPSHARAAVLRRRATSAPRLPSWAAAVCFDILC
jgi:hypothetical protein